MNNFDFDFEKFKANVESNLQKQVQASTLPDQLQGLGITSAVEQAEYLDALIGLVAAGAVPGQIREIAKQVGAGLSKPQPTRAGQLSADHLGKTITVSFRRSKVTGTLDRIDHVAVVTCVESHEKPIRIAARVKLTVGGIVQHQIDAGTQIKLEDES